ncbi:MAG: hypothetical protein K8S54_11480 [Spirochaetia bacterium]|nr:hypothetical protein [Spirochaetia bacterium]
MRFLTLALFLGISASVIAGSIYRYRIVTQPTVFVEAPASKTVLAQIPVGTAVQETGLPGKPWIVKQAGEDWIHVAYWGEVGWIPVQAVSEISNIKKPSAEDFRGLWIGNAHCKQRSFLNIQFNGSFQGSRCIFCSVEGCPEGISGSWKIRDGMLCIQEARGESACFFLWNQMLISDPESGFIWEYHGSAPLSGLRR